MREMSDATAENFATEATTLCMCWRFTRADGAVFGATDHDAPLVFDGVEHEPARGLSAALLESGAGLAPGHAAVDGAFDVGFLDPASLAAGAWDGAHVDVWRADWSAPDRRTWIWGGRLSDVSLRGGSFHAELVSLKADLERPIGRVYARTCDAMIGDGRCRADLSAAPVRLDGVVEAALGGGRYQAMISAFETGWFDGGAVSWTSGGLAGVRQAIRRAWSTQEGAVFELTSPGADAAAGDAFVATAGCDKRFATCANKFANTLNFRGFPYMPGNDAVLAGPSSGAAGGRRT